MSDDLLDWSSIEHRYGSGLLLGNGASLAVSSEFSYSSLFDTANLSRRDTKLFDALATTNFEQVLSALRIGQIVCASAGHATIETRRQYRRVRKALVEAVVDAHVRWQDIPAKTLLAIRSGLRGYEHVFSTNYDLLVYWAVMSRQAAGFIDYFWGAGNTFDAGDAASSRSVTRVLYVHGGVHLVRDDDGTARKRVAQSQGLLDSFARSHDIPLFVSEGTAEDKLRVIRQSDYLTHAYETLAESVDSLTVLGHRLGPEDAHIRRLLARAHRLAIAIVPARSSTIRREKARYMSFLPGVRIEFFSSESHPLGSPALSVI
jgi:hypothetical protein